MSATRSRASGADEPARGFRSSARTASLSPTKARWRASSRWSSRRPGPTSGSRREPDGHIQATGRDQRGRKQYRYHPRWSESRDEVKYSNLADFARALPKIRERIDADLRRRELPRERVVASIVWLLDNTMIRVGNTVYARDNKSFGLTTLKTAACRGRGIEAALRLQGQVRQGMEAEARRPAHGEDHPQHPGTARPASLPVHQRRRRAARGPSQDVNDYIREAGGDDFSSKHFRTWGGTVRALALFAELPLPDTKAGVARAMNAVVDEVARHLGNTRAVCRKCYIHPEVMESWLEGPARRRIDRRQKIPPQTQGPRRRGSAGAALAGSAQGLTGDSRLQAGLT